MDIKIVVGKNGMMPSYQSDGASGFDLHAAMDVWLPPFGTGLVGTDIRMAIPEGFEGQVRSRSGLALEHNIWLANGIGTIDSDYRGEIKVLLYNHCDKRVKVEKGDRIAQMVICPVTYATFQQCNNLGTTTRGSNGFGSTGI